MSSPADQPAVETGSKRRFRPTLTSVLTAILVLLILIAAVLQILPANEYLLLPGSAQKVAPMISVKGYPPTHGTDNLYMTDVRVAKVDHVLEELYGKVNPSADLEPAQSFSGGLSFSQYLQLNDELMADSIHKAEAAALTVALGYKLHFSTSGPQVVFLMPRSPAAAVMDAGDIIKAIDGHRVHRAVEVSPLVKAHRPGQIIHLTVLRHGRVHHFAIRSVASKNGVPNKRGKTPLIGVYVQDQIVFPIRISIRPGRVGGPSAGLMFSLGIIQRLQRRDITHGCKVAGTGTMDYNGAVGEIGGAKQKVIAAGQAGAKYFFVPNVPDNLKPAMAHRGNITVVPVRTLREALHYLNHIKPCSK